MRLSDTQLAVLARDLQWSLDDMAFQLPTGRFSEMELSLLIGKLETLTEQLKNRQRSDDPAPT